MNNKEILIKINEFKSFPVNVIGLEHTFVLKNHMILNNSMTTSDMFKLIDTLEYYLREKQSTKPNSQNSYVCKHCGVENKISMGNKEIMNDYSEVSFEENCRNCFKINYLHIKTTTNIVVS